MKEEFLNKSIKEDMAGTIKTAKTSTCKCPKCKAKLVVTEFNEHCRRCGYSKHREPSNLTKKLYGFL